MSTQLFFLGLAAALILDVILIWMWRQRRSGRRVLPGWLKNRRFLLLDYQNLALVASCILAAVPAWLVVRDRWFGAFIPGSGDAGFWCARGILCNSPLPTYVILILISILLTTVLVGSQPQEFTPWSEFSPAIDNLKTPANMVGERQSRVGYVLILVSGIGFFTLIVMGLVFQRVPGWEYALLIASFILGLFLKEFPLEQARASWRANRGRVGAILLAFIGLIAFLSSLYETRQSLWVFTVLLAFSLLNALRHARRIPAIFWLVLLALVLYTLEMDSWWFSIIGDEYEFFRFARYIAEEQPIGDIGVRLFHAQGVYGSNPYFSSVIQAASIKTFGPTNFGWRFSSLFVAALGIGLYYAFLRTYTRASVALLGAGFLVASHYLMSFGKIGYNNLQALFALTLCLWVAARAHRTRRIIWFSLLGFCLGLCLYVYPVAIYTIPVVLLLLSIYLPPGLPSTRRHWGSMLLALVIMIFPLLIQPDYLKSKLFAIFVSNPSITGSLPSTLSHLASNAFYSLLGFTIIPEESHFVSVSYADPVSAIFIILGLAWLISRGRSQRFGAFALGSFALILFLVGASHDRMFPPTTRMFMLLPWYGLLASLGLHWAKERWAQTLPSLWVNRAAVPAVIMVALGANLYQAYVVSPDRMTRYQSFQVLFLRLAERTFSFPERAESRFVILNNPQYLDVESLHELLTLYRIPFSPWQLSELALDSPALDDTSLAVIQSPNTLTIINPYLPVTWQESLSEEMLEQGLDDCEIRTTRGEARFFVWDYSDRSPPCEW